MSDFYDLVVRFEDAVRSHQAGSVGSVGYAAYRKAKDELLAYDQSEGLLRDRFAIAALQGLMARGASRDWTPSDVILAEQAFELADQMLAARGGAK